MNEITSYENIRSFDDLKGAMSTELNKAAVSFVRIGYLLKTARDTEILKETQYADVNEFASAEFGLDKSQVSRFVRINDRFSIGGYSEHLKVEYQEYGSAKLSLMLTLPDEINEELSPEYSKSDIQAIKEEYDEEQKITDIEVMLEEQAEAPESEDGADEFLSLVVKELNDEHPEPLSNLHFENTAKDLNYLMDDLQEAYMPDGECVYNIRISGMGRFMVSMKEDGITIINMREPSQKSPVSWNEFMKLTEYDEAHRTFTIQKEKPATEPKPKKVEKSKAAKQAPNWENSGVVENAFSADSEDKNTGKEHEEEAAEQEPAAAPERVEGEILPDRTYEQLLKTTHAERKIAMDVIETLWELKDRLDENERMIKLRTVVEMRDLAGNLLNALEDITQCCEYYENKEAEEGESKE